MSQHGTSGSPRADRGSTGHQGAPPVLPDARMSLGPAVLADLFPEGESYRRSLITYTVLLTLASLIAAFGLYQDSVASIIGAMVVAPMGGAIMAFAGSLVTGRTEWQPRTFAQVVLSALWVIGLLVNFWYVYPTVGLLFVMIAFASVALGGFGSIKGAFSAGVLIGMVEMLFPVFGHLMGSEFLGPHFKFTIVYFAYFVIVVLRPQGLFGWKH